MWTGKSQSLPARQSNRRRELFCQLRSSYVDSYSRPKASKTFPGRPRNAPYPELTNTIPPATAGPGPSIDAPLAGTPLTVGNSRFVSNCHTISPFATEYIRSEPSTEPDNTAPGMAVIAADWAALQPRPVPQVGGGGCATQTRSPVARATACRPPGRGCVMSETAKYTLSASAAAPHSIPPRTPP